MWTYTDGLDESETQNGVGEQLATEGRVAGNTVQEGSENETDTDTGTSQTDGGGTHTQVLGDLDQGVGHLRRVGTAGGLLESLLGGGVQDLGLSTQGGGVAWLEDQELARPATKIFRSRRFAVVEMIRAAWEAEKRTVEIAPEPIDGVSMDEGSWRQVDCHQSWNILVMVRLAAVLVI